MISRMLVKMIAVLWVGIAAGWLNPAVSYSEEASEKVLKLHSGLYYTIQKGDTLWDLSERFFDSPWVWPDLWQKNSQITNPHRLYPGEQIRLFSREETQTMVVESRPEPEVAVEPQEPPYYFYPPINSVGFIKERPVRPSGAIFKVKGNKAMISYGDLVYIRPIGRPTFTPGDRFTIYRVLEPLKDGEIKADVGIQHCILGLVEITEGHPKFAMGRIVQSRQTIELNDLLMPYEARSPKITLTQSKKGLEGKIIASEGHERIFGDQAVVFIDKGRQDGVRVGQSYYIYEQEKERLDSKKKEDLLLSPVDYGDILILHTEETTATALITRAEKTVRPGARIRSPF